LKTHLAGQRHTDDDEVKTIVMQWLSNQAATFFDDEIQIAHDTINALILMGIM